MAKLALIVLISMTVTFSMPSKICRHCSNCKPSQFGYGNSVTTGNLNKGWHTPTKQNVMHHRTGESEFEKYCKLYCNNSYNNGEKGRFPQKQRIKSNTFGTLENYSFNNNNAIREKFGSNRNKPCHNNHYRGAVAINIGGSKGHYHPHNHITNTVDKEFSKPKPKFFGPFWGIKVKPGKHKYKPKPAFSFFKPFFHISIPGRPGKPGRPGGPGGRPYGYEYPPYKPGHPGRPGTLGGHGGKLCGQKVPKIIKSYYYPTPNSLVFEFEIPKKTYGKHYVKPQTHNKEHIVLHYKGGLNKAKNLHPNPTGDVNKFNSNELEKLKKLISPHKVELGKPSKFYNKQTEKPSNKFIGNSIEANISFQGELEKSNKLFKDQTEKVNTLNHKFLGRQRESYIKHSGKLNFFKKQEAENANITEKSDKQGKLSDKNLETLIKLHKENAEIPCKHCKNNLVTSDLPSEEEINKIIDESPVPPNMSFAKDLDKSDKFSYEKKIKPDKLYANIILKPGKILGKVTVKPDDTKAKPVLEAFSEKNKTNSKFGLTIKLTNSYSEHSKEQNTSHTIDSVTDSEHSEPANGPVKPEKNLMWKPMHFDNETKVHLGTPPVTGYWEHPSAESHPHPIHDNEPAKIESGESTYKPATSAKPAAVIEESNVPKINNNEKPKNPSESSSSTYANEFGGSVNIGANIGPAGNQPPGYSGGNIGISGNNPDKSGEDEIGAHGNDQEESNGDNDGKLGNPSGGFGEGNSGASLNYFNGVEGDLSGTQGNQSGYGPEESSEISTGVQGNYPAEPGGEDSDGESNYDESDGIGGGPLGASKGISNQPSFGPGVSIDANTGPPGNYPEGTDEKGNDMVGNYLGGSNGISGGPSGSYSGKPSEGISGQPSYGPGESIDVNTGLPGNYPEGSDGEGSDMAGNYPGGSNGIGGDLSESYSERPNGDISVQPGSYSGKPSEGISDQPSYGPGESIDVNTGLPENYPEGSDGEGSDMAGNYPGGSNGTGGDLSESYNERPHGDISVQPGGAGGDGSGGPENQPENGNFFGGSVGDDNDSDHYSGTTGNNDFDGSSTGNIPSGKPAEPIGEDSGGLNNEHEGSITGDFNKLSEESFENISDIANPNIENFNTEEPNFGKPNVEESNAEKPNVEEPNIEKPHIGESNIEEPNNEELNIEEPNIEKPNVEEHNVEEPNIEKPNVEEPNIEKPNIEKPNVEEPNIEKSNVEEPNIEKPNVEEPNIEKPNVEEPDVETPDIDTPDIEMPNIETPDLGDLFNGAGKGKGHLSISATSTGGTAYVAQLRAANKKKLRPPYQRVRHYLNPNAPHSNHRNHYNHYNLHDHYNHYNSHPNAMKNRIHGNRLNAMNGSIGIKIIGAPTHRPKNKMKPIRVPTPIYSQTVSASIYKRINRNYNSEMKNFRPRQNNMTDHVSTEINRKFLGLF